LRLDLLASFVLTTETRHSDGRDTELPICARRRRTERTHRTSADGAAKARQNGTYALVLLGGTERG
jgi:hypothetical protein